jgi:hypothetical protein
MDNLPTDIVKRDLHSDVVIGVHLLAPELVAGGVKSLVGVFARAYSAGTELNERCGEALADLLVTVDTRKYSVGDYGKAVGAISFETAIGDAGRRKVFFTFGRIFLVRLCSKDKTSSGVRKRRFTLQSKFSDVHFVSIAHLAH